MKFIKEQLLGKKCCVKSMRRRMVSSVISNIKKQQTCSTLNATLNQMSLLLSQNELSN